MELQEMHCKNCGSRQKSLFCKLEEEELDTLSINKNCINFKKGEFVFEERNTPKGIYCINSGKVKIYKLGDKGKKQIVRLAKDGDIIGYRSLLSGERYTAFARCIEPANICFVPKETFFDLIKTNQDVSMRMMEMLSRELRKSEQALTGIVQKPVKERLAETILMLKETYGYEDDKQTLNVTLSREDIADLVGTATETVIRFLAQLKDDGVIEQKGKRIVIKNMQSLVREANIFD